MALKEMLEQSAKDYEEYVREQAKLSREKAADPEFISMMKTAADHEDRYWTTVVKKNKKQRMMFFRERGTYENNLTPLPYIAPKRKRRLSEQEKDAQLFEKGAEWLEQNHWTRGWRERVELPDGRMVDARCALGSILAAIPALEGCDSTPNDKGQVMIENALGRVGMNMDAVISYNDNHAENLREVARYLRGLAYKIREGL